jgi:hypothetical protein
VSQKLKIDARGKLALSPEILLIDRKTQSSSLSRDSTQSSRNECPFISVHLLSKFWIGKTTYTNIVSG